MRKGNGDEPVTRLTYVGVGLNVTIETSATPTMRHRT